jgi:hypothetical protein
MSYHFSRIALLFAVCYALSPFAVAANPTSSMEDIRKIGVVTLLPEKVEVQYTGLTIFNDHYYQGDVSWKINENVERIVKRVLSQRQRFEVKDIAYDRDAMWKDYEVQGLSGPTRLSESFGGTPRLDALKAHLAKLSADNGLDGILLILPGREVRLMCGSRGGSCGNGVGNTGVGVYTNGGPRPHKADNVYVSLELNFVTAKNPQLAASAVMSAYEPVGFGKRPDFASVPATIWTGIESDTRRMLEAELPLAIAKMGNLSRAKVEAPVATDLSTIPTLTVNTECCLSRSLADNISAGYYKAATENGLKPNSETALLTVKKITVRTGSMWAPGNMRGENRVEAVLAFRGNEYWIEESARMIGKLEDVSVTVGQLAFEQLRTVLGMPATKKVEVAAPAAN